MKACEKGNEVIMGILLERFTPQDILASLTAQNKDGNTCLMKACATGNLKVKIKYLCRQPPLFLPNTSNPHSAVNAHQMEQSKTF